LEKHIQIHHKTEYADYEKQKDEAISLKKKAGKSSCKNVTITSFINTNILMDWCVELATANGRPLALFDDSPMKKILNAAAKITNSSVIPNSQNVREEIIKAAKGKRIEIKKMIQNSIVHLSLDMATCLGRSFIGI
jgi:hypothetical protein